jgi:triacylglycerol lipase
LSVVTAALLGLVAVHSHAPASATTSSPVVRTTVPVLLVPGWFDTARDLAALRIRLRAAGWEHVETLTFRDRIGSNRDHAAEIDSVVTQMLLSTGTAEVDIVAHSMGGLATRWFLKTRPEARVRRAVFIASPHRGTLSAMLAWGAGSDEMLPRSEFLDSLNQGPVVPPGVEAITIRTPIDTHIFPAESATLPDVNDYTVCCPTHAGLIRDEKVFRLVSDFLEAGDGASAGR